MGRCSYNSKRLIPCPLVEFTKNYNFSEDGTKIGSVWNITITGKIISWMGSPNSSGTFWTSSGYPSDEVIDETLRLGAVFRKQEAIRTLFATDGYSLEWQSDNAGSAPIKCNPRIKSINFPQGIWWNDSDYTINAEADVLYINGQPYGEDTFDNYIDSGSESWQIETDESSAEGVGMPRTYRLTHSVQAKGKRFFNSAGTLVDEAWKQARAWVLPRLGFDSSFILSSGVKDLPAYYGGYNQVNSESIDELGGNYSVTETWILSSGSALEAFDININQSADTGLTKVDINGNITGLESRDSNLQLLTSKYTNANTKFTMASGLALTRAQSYAGISLNVIPLSTSVGVNPINGTISYNFAYDNRPSNVVPGAKSEIISINDSLTTDVIAIVPVLGRTKGPVLQNMYTSREHRRTLDVELVVTPPSFSDLTAALTTERPSSNGTMATALNTIVSAANPINSGASKSYLEDNTERWNPREGRYSMTKTWVWEA